ncbi:unnamed protein product, partial [Discosporangium mesarthrocarpum]
EHVQDTEDAGDPMFYLGARAYLDSRRRRTNIMQRFRELGRSRSLMGEGRSHKAILSSALLDRNISTTLTGHDTAPRRNSVFS